MRLHDSVKKHDNTLSIYQFPRQKKKKKKTMFSLFANSCRPWQSKCVLMCTKQWCYECHTILSNSTRFSFRKNKDDLHIISVTQYIYMKHHRNKRKSNLTRLHTLALYEQNLFKQKCLSYMYKRKTYHHRNI